MHERRDKQTNIISLSHVHFMRSEYMNISCEDCPRNSDLDSDYKIPTAVFLLHERKK
jgi:hypothetical protein